jgi:hypothetical protein
MPNFFTIKDGWSLDEQLGYMLQNSTTSRRLAESSSG